MKTVNGRLGEGKVPIEAATRTAGTHNGGIGPLSAGANAGPEVLTSDVDKEDLLAKERERLLSQLSSGSLSTTKARVAFILNHYPETRDSDVALTWRYWKTFQSTIVDDPNIPMQDMFARLERESSIVRVRAKIQNEYNLFVPSQSVRRQRRAQEEEVWLDMIEDKPGKPYVQIYTDETGKTQDFVIVGSVWANDSFAAARMWHHLTTWCAGRGIESEFHFQDLSRKSLEGARAFFSEVLGHSHFLSFKAVAVNQRGMRRSLDDIVTELYRQLVIQGFEHEFARGRLRPPRIVQIWKDADDGTDRILLAKLRQSLEVSFRDYFEKQVSFCPIDDSIEPVQPIDSRENYFVQVADLFAGSMNRVLNPQESRNHKDEFAEFVLGALGVVLSRSGCMHVGDQDIATVVVL